MRFGLCLIACLAALAAVSPDQRKMLRTKAVNDRLRSLRLPACSLLPLGTCGTFGAALRSRRLELDSGHRRCPV